MDIQTITEDYISTLELPTPEQSLDYLNQLQNQHIAKFGFNSLAVVLGNDIGIESNDVFDKIVTQGLGGYCFEHNKLVYDVLTHLGFETRILMGRVIYNNLDAEPPRTHRITLVTLNGEDYIVDCGFGHYGAWFPVKVSAEPQQQLGDTYRIIQHQDGRYLYQLIKDGEFFTLYTFDFNQYNEADCLTGNFYSYKHPNAGFVNNLVACRKENGTIWSLRNDQLFVIEQGQTRITKIDTPELLQTLLKELFTLTIDEQQAEYLFERFLSNK
ncbi:arylamine N-acetyltransferase family protein [Litoribrevibacter albus]|uniref:Arylamine N-acetyltransferase n=1 Tax=Litoribrevibacter albus TaxID=1473156 RepID=A0AA37W7U2_9GAMM|nr:arylamine N-acetyltransferase [Litoribrevibacter albus]GLQ32892.1 hypothetical protein GCM10007876_33710 [Litoribrevibacter albus]